ncbi:MAG TPA: DUF1844 domain-containing protein [Alphaproteobacteria bacterium]|nr:DUF1844 domain-containing protein [Alphaproteobacteria bacterium]
MAEEQSERAFTVSDKRFSARRESAEPAAAHTQTGASSTAQQPRTQPQSEARPSASPEGIDFASFIVSLGTQAFMHLGDIPNPMNQKREKDLPAAKHLIDLLGMLQAKTKGNLNGDEDRLLQQLLFDLRLRYVRETGR